MQAELLAELEGEMFDLRDQLAQAAGERKQPKSWLTRLSQLFRPGEGLVSRLFSKPPSAVQQDAFPGWVDSCQGPVQGEGVEDSPALAPTA